MVWILCDVYEYSTSLKTLLMAKYPAPTNPNSFSSVSVRSAKTLPLMFLPV